MQRDEPPPKMSKLAIEAETESDRYDTHTAVFCYACNGKEIERTSDNVCLCRVASPMNGHANMADV